MTKKSTGSVSLDGIWRPLHSTGAPFFGVLSTRNAIEQYPINIDPDFQRGRVWTEDQQELFMGHLLEGGEVQPVIVNQGPGGDWEVPELIDGKQRVTACLLWADGEIAARLWDNRRIKIGDLDAVSRTQCRLQIGLRYSMVRLTRIECLELYIRLNRGGTPHTSAEIGRVRALLNAELKKGEQ